MFVDKSQPIIISIGGSLIIPNGGVNTNFLSQLNSFIRKEVKRGRRFMLVTGGGTTARHYIEAGKKVVGDIIDEDLDWLAIHVTRLNGHLLRTILMDIAHPRIVENYDHKLKNWVEPVVIGTGWKPGWSTDYDCVILARDYKSNFMINLTDLYWVYNKDPNKYKNARPIKKMTWEELQRLIGTKWIPGFSTPFDPIAAKLARKLKLTVISTNGHDFKNLENIIEGRKFKGTVIANSA